MRELNRCGLAAPMVLPDFLFRLSMKFYLYTTGINIMLWEERYMLTVFFYQPAFYC